MIFQSFLRNLVSKIINSVVVVGLYYGFLTTFSIGPSYFFLLRAQVMEEGEEGIEKKVAATTGFIMGQLMLFISIYYTPLHLALGRPHTITVLCLPYLLFHFFWNNHNHFFDYGYTSRNSMRNLSTQCVFLNNLIFQLFNHFLFPSSMLARLVNIYMFRCNNKMFFVTSSFVGWLIGLILFMKSVGFVFVWIQQNHSISKYIRSKLKWNKYLVLKFNYLKYLALKFKNSMDRIFIILLFIFCLYYLGRMPSPIFTKKLNETSETKESEDETEETKESEDETSETKESEDETDVEIEKKSETKETKQEEEGFTEEDPSPSLFSEEKEDPDKMDETEKIRVNGKDKTEAYYKNSPTSYSGNQDISKLEILKEEKKNLFWFEKPLRSLLFDYKRWNRPTRYIQNDRLENAVRNEMSQYFFDTCQNDGKKRISFTYPPSLSIFWEMLQRKISLSTTEKLLYDELYNYWIYTNEQKKKSLSNEFANRIAVLDKGLFYIDGLDKKTQLCNEKTKKEYLPKINDPFLNGPYRGIRKKGFSPSIINETAVQNWIDGIFINKIHSILHNDYNYHEFEQKKETLKKKEISKEIRHFMPLMSPFSGESTFNRKGIYLEEEQIGSEDQEQFFKFLVDAIIGLKRNKKLQKKAIGITEISKQVPCWSYKLIDEEEQQENANQGDVPMDHEIRSRDSKRVVLFDQNDYFMAEDIDIPIENTKPNEEKVEVALFFYPPQSDFNRDLIKGSMRAQRRKIVIWELLQAHTHSPLFLDRIEHWVFRDIKRLIRLIERILKKKIEKKSEFQISDYSTEDEKSKEEIRLEIAETWENFPYGPELRGLTLVTQSILRKYIRLPLLIIAKNIGRQFLFQRPEWSEDFEEWKKEKHFRCTYNGVPLSETAFPEDWLTEGIQIKIVFPFCLKPWHRSMLRPSNQHKMKKEKKKDPFCFLTVWGMETDVPFGFALEQPPFFKPIFRELDKKIRKLKKKVQKIYKEKIEFLLTVPIQRIKKKFLRRSPIRVFGLRDESIEIEKKKEKDSAINPNIVHESSIQDEFMKEIIYSDPELEQQKKDLINRTVLLHRTIKTTKEKITPISQPNKTHSFYGTQNVESPQNMGQIFKRKNTRLIRKSNYFKTFFKDRLFVDLFLYIINIPRINIEFCLESTKKFCEKRFDNNAKIQERVEKKKTHTIQFRKSILDFVSHIKKIKKNSKVLSDFSFLSQAYVFYKLSQVEVINLYLYKLKSIFQYRGTFLFLKNEIKKDFGTQVITSSKLKPKKLQNSGRTQWKNWLKFKSHYQYDLSQLKWSQLGPQKWRNRVTEYCEVEKQKLQKNKRNSDKKDKLLNAKNKKNAENFLLLDQKENFTKNDKYNILAYNFIFYEDKKDSYSYGEPLQVNKNQEFFDTSNYYLSTNKLIDMWWSIPITNYLGIKRISDIEKNKNRKYFFDWKIIHFSLRQRMDIEAWINISSRSTENNKTETKNYKIVDKIEKKHLFYRTIYQEINPPQKKEISFDWMGMNEELLSHPISNLEFLLFPKFFLSLKEYKKSLFSNCNGIDNFSEKKKINRTKKKNPFTTSRILNKKKRMELENRNQGEKEVISQRDSGSDVQKKFEFVISKHQKDILEKYIESDIKDRRNRKKKQNKSVTEEELDSFLKRYFVCQFSWGDNSFNKKLLENIKLYLFLLKFPNPREITVASIDRGEMPLNIMLSQPTVSQFLKGGLFFIDPIRLSVKGKGQFLLYQTIGISLIDKSKHKKNKKRKIDSINKKNPDEWIPRYEYEFDLLVPETILSPRRRRKWRILMCLNSSNNNGMYSNAVSYNRNHINNCSQIFDENKDLRHENNTVLKYKVFLWPNYRLEDLACMNRYWFDTNNGSRFSLLRIRMYPRFKIYL
uniref:Protein TIC 214 n=1 Tax=Silene wilfordii TaxID=1850527 RepID=A0A1Z1BMH4_9CARY|nr:ycf1 protein [Silene wilfordii]YP_009389733.1 ycf1 protein [Silene wilfordii]ANG08150.1 ycf1 protein [Silene wilfordii]ANG08162.1 ycf1 protein [Silene wilfordii]